MRALQNFWSRSSNLLAPRETAVKRIYVASQEASCCCFLEEFIRRSMEHVHVKVEHGVTN
jgi:hypothetical protein